MPIARFIKGSRFHFNHQVFLVEQELTENKLLLRSITTGSVEAVPREELERAWADGKLSFATTGKNTVTSSQDPQMREYATPDLSVLPPDQRNEAVRRYNLILPLLRLRPSERTDAYLESYADSLFRRESNRTHVPRAHTESSCISDGVEVDASKFRKGGRRKGDKLGTADSARSLRRWLSDFSRSGGDIRSLVPATSRQGGFGNFRIPAEVEQHISGVIEWCRGNQANPKREVQDVYDLIYERIAADNKYRNASNQLKIPSISTVYRRLGELGAWDILDRRLSILEAQARAGVMPGPAVTRIMELVEYDITPMDCLVVSDYDRLPLGRPVTCIGRDKYSGMPHGTAVGFGGESANLVMSALYYGIMPKEDVQALYGTRHPFPVKGLPEKIVTDNGSGFDNYAFSDACRQLSIHWEKMQRGKAWFKGGIEAFIKEHNRGFAHRIPGSVFSNVLQKGDYDAVENACITLSTYVRMLHIWMLDVYAQSKHRLSSTLVGGIPARLWDESVRAGFQPLWYDDATRLRVLLLMPEFRQLTRHGIRFEHLTYQSPELQDLRRQVILHSHTKPNYSRGFGRAAGEAADALKVLFKFDTNNLSRIFVLNPLDHTKWLEVPCTRQDYTAKLDRWTHQIIVSFLNLKNREYINEDELVKARMTLKKIAAEELHLTQAADKPKNVKTRAHTNATKAEGLDSVGRPGDMLAKAPSSIPLFDSAPPENNSRTDSNSTAYQSLDSGSVGQDLSSVRRQLPGAPLGLGSEGELVSTDLFMSITALGYSYSSGRNSATSNVGVAASNSADDPNTAKAAPELGDGMSTSVEADAYAQPVARNGGTRSRSDSRSQSQHRNGKKGIASNKNTADKGKSGKGQEFLRTEASNNGELEVQDPQKVSVDVSNEEQLELNAPSCWSGGYKLRRGQEE